MSDTPMMQQWRECKNEAPNALLFFRLGDFYEAFYEDAEVIAAALNLTLTERQGVPMCGVPWHTSEGYLDKLVMKGHRVAIAEQMQDAKSVAGKGMIKRQVVRCVSPGTGSLGGVAFEKEMNYFACLAKEGIKEGAHFGLAALDVTTGKFVVTECSDQRSVINELIRLNPKELLVSKKFYEKESALLGDIRLSLNVRIQTEEVWRFDRIATESTLLHHFRVATLDGFGIEAGSQTVAAGALLKHVKEELKVDLSPIKTLVKHKTGHFLELDRATLENLEIIDSLHEDKRNATLLDLIDKTKTPMGGRLLREWLKAPLTDLAAIRARQDVLAEFLEYHSTRYVQMCAFDDHLKQVRDLERLIVRIQANYAKPSEYVALRSSLEQLPRLLEFLSSFRSRKFPIPDLQEPFDLMKRALTDSPPLRVSDGGVIREGYDPTLDSIRTLREQSRDWLQQYETRLKAELEIKTLKVGYNKMFGYYIEVSRGQADKMPQSFARRQTLTTGERFISPELKEYEEKILNADERIEALEKELFAALQAKILQFYEPIIEAAQVVAEIDALRSLAAVAEKYQFKRPTLDSSKRLTIIEGRHPVIEALLSRKFIPNDIQLDGENKTLMLITGPNMAGKSTYIRQIALIVILAQMGSFVPAKEAHIGIIDKLFSRIGASDNLARGQSTFMVEMAETAAILNQATDSSLVILDEIGRGTSTYDGISIATAVAEFLLKTPGKRAKTLFATHYYELTKLESREIGAENYTVAVADTHDGIHFLHKIIKGKTDRSYGIHVAKLAGMPELVVYRAAAILKELEKQKNHPKEADKPKEEADLFQHSILQSIKNCNLNQTSPLEALTKLIEWQKTLS